VTPALGFLGRIFDRRPAPPTLLIFDAGLLFNEMDLLAIRLGELWDAVDHFVVVESDRTFAGRPKPYFFGAHVSRFGRFAGKILYHKFQADESLGATGQARTTIQARVELEAE
jgi:hypothetical protein